MKKLIALLLAVTMMFALTACGGEKAEYANRLEEIKARGVLTVATEPSHIPLWPCASGYDLHKKAGGLPLHAITAPNIHPMSKHWTGGLQTGREV